nr:salivary glue protein Sgs-3-like [Ipomoea batatas]
MPHPPTVAADIPPEGSLIEEIQFFWNEAERVASLFDSQKNHVRHSIHLVRPTSLNSLPVQSSIEWWEDQSTIEFWEGHLTIEWWEDQSTTALYFAKMGWGGGGGQSTTEMGCQLTIGMGDQSTTEMGCQLTIGMGDQSTTEGRGIR